MRGYKIPILERASGVPKEQDKIVEKMKKTKKPVEFVLSYDGRTLAYFFRVGSDTWPDFGYDLSDQTDLALRRKWMVSLQKNAKIVTEADLAAFDKVNPTPADPEQVAELEQQIGVTESIIKSETERQGLVREEVRRLRLAAAPHGLPPLGEEAGLRGLRAVHDRRDRQVPGPHDDEDARLEGRRPAREDEGGDEGGDGEGLRRQAAGRLRRREGRGADDRRRCPDAEVPAVRFKEAEKTVASEKKKLAGQKAELAKLKGRK